MHSLLSEPLTFSFRRHRQIDGIEQKTKSHSLLFEVFLGQKQALAAYLASKLIRPEDLDDILQEIACIALQQEERDDIKSPKAYLFIIARNAMLKHFKLQTQAMQREISEHELMALPSDEPSTEEKVASMINLESFLQQVQRLPPQCRKVFLLRKMLGWSHKKIAGHLDISSSTVERHITNAITRLDKSRQKSEGLFDIPRIGNRK
jgi:RNA polymerase sigma-70 factor (ECF subfamily)